MSTTKIAYGIPVKLLVEYQGYPDGRLVEFEIWQKKGGEEKEMSTIYGVTKGGTGIGWWIPLIDRKGILSLEEKIEYREEEERYYFVARIDDNEVKSEDMVFTYPLEVYLEDESKTPINDVKCTVAFSDKSKKEEVFQNGRIRLNDVPAGKFEIHVEGYEFVFKPTGKSAR